MPEPKEHIKRVKLAHTKGFQELRKRTFEIPFTYGPVSAKIVDDFINVYFRCVEGKTRQSITIISLHTGERIPYPCEFIDTVVLSPIRQANSLSEMTDLSEESDIIRHLYVQYPKQGE